MIISNLASSSSSIALVTGGSGGIGLAIAKKLASEKMNVITADIAAPQHEMSGIVFKECDVRQGEDIDKLYAWMSNNTGLPDVLVLNAGKGIHEQLLEGDPEKWKDVIDLNVMGVLRCIRAFVPAIKEKGGHVVIISSVSANKPYTYGGIYSASKAAIEIIAETLRLEAMPRVKVTVVAAGVTDTTFFTNQVSGSTSVEEIGMGSLPPEDIAEDVFYAISKKNGVINKIITRPPGQDF